MDEAIAAATKPLTRARFTALCFSRKPIAAMMSREVEWWSDAQERVLGVVLFDLTDKDWAWIVLGRDETGLFRAIDVDSSIDAREEAQIALRAALAKHAVSGEVFPQHDNSGKRHEILRVRVDEAKLHRNFKIIASGDHHAAARRMIEETALAFVDVDGVSGRSKCTSAVDSKCTTLEG